MHLQITLSNIAAFLGMVLGTAGFSISLMNYLRDKPRILVTLQWDMANTNTEALMGLARVTNVGRRPIFISVCGAQVPKGF